MVVFITVGNVPKDWCTTLSDASGGYIVVYVATILSDRGGSDCLMAVWLLHLISGEGLVRLQLFHP